MTTVDLRPGLALAAAGVALSLTLGTPAQADHHAAKAPAKAGSASHADHADHAGSGSDAPAAPARAERKLAGGAIAYGADLAMPEATPIRTLQDAPDAWAGRQVRITGTVTDVCPMAGCWMKIADATGAEVTLKVRDGVMVFPMTAKGQQVTAEGTVRKIDLSAEQARAYLAHLAEEKGEAFDPASVAGPMTIVRVDGRGALIQPQ